MRWWRNVQPDNVADRAEKMFLIKSIKNVFPADTAALKGKTNRRRASVLLIVVEFHYSTGRIYRWSVRNSARGAYRVNSFETASPANSTKTLSISRLVNWARIDFAYPSHVRLVKIVYFNPIFSIYKQEEMENIFDWTCLVCKVSRKQREV